MINKYIDHTLLKANALEKDIEKLCLEAIKYNFKSVMVNPSQILRCKKILKDSSVKIGTVIGFPLGQNTIKVKVFEVKDAIKNGVDEIDYVLNISELKNKNYSYLKEEMEMIVKLCQEHKIVSKVIIETCYLTKLEKIKVLEIIKEVKPDYVKTSTGFGTKGAELVDIKLMKDIVGDTVKIKAAGGIRDLRKFEEMIKAGAKRIGTSSGVEIIKEYNGGN
ncbi:MAG: deoxyribose-phosphate aldolase [Bacilli bacterium]|jgi:deoxyribose-phosphate aldolase